MDYIRTQLDAPLKVDGIYTIHYFEYTKDFSYSGEFHNFWEIVYADKQRVVITADATELTLEAGQLYIHRPNESTVQSISTPTTELESTEALTDEITLENDYGFNYWDLEDDEIEEARSGILIDRDLTIDGDGHKLDGRGFARAFNIASESHVTLKNIIFERCYADEGGAIYNSGTLTIENCQFLNCGNNWEEDCKTSNGGAIYNGGDLDVTDSIFYQNEARKGAGCADTPGRAGRRCTAGHRHG